jgi:hypothetical protein
MPNLSRLPALLLVSCAMTTSACSSFGGRRLDHDQVDYAHALSSAAKREALSNIVSLRYGDAPSFLAATQIIAAYQFDIGGSFLGIGAASDLSGNTVQMGGTLALNNNPTFTFTPTTGEAFASAYIRPLSPALILPMIESGAPIDLLLRLAVQSIGGLQNSAALGGTNSNGNPDFFELIHVLRRLQIAGSVSVRFVKQKDGDQVFLSIDDGAAQDAGVAADAQRARTLLHLESRQPNVEIVYGTGRGDGKSVPMQTRSVISILSELGAQIEVPQTDIANHATLPTVQVIGIETRPTIIVHVGGDAPKDTFVKAEYRRKHYWIADDDFDSKFAFSLLQNLIDLAQTDQSAKPPLVTIPAG